MYPTDNRQDDLARLRSDLEYLVKTVEDAPHKPYLKGPLIDSLVALHHSRSVAERAVEQYFKVSIQ